MGALPETVWELKMAQSLLRLTSSMKQPDTPNTLPCLIQARLSHGMRSRVINNVLPLLVAILLPQYAHASLFEGEQLDKVANIMSWVVLVLVPIIGIGIFWIIHILPEKIAERRRHPQAKAIQCLCLLSLVFGGLLWPLAWLWAYSRPVLHKMAYGTDVGEPHGHSEKDTEERKDTTALSEEASRLRVRLAELEAQINDQRKNA